MTYAQGFSWGRQRAAPAVVALFVALTALVAAPPPPGGSTARATGRLVRVIVRQIAHAANGPSGAIKRLGGEVGRPLAIIGGFAAKVPAGAIPALRHEPGVLSVTTDSRPQMAGDDWRADGLPSPPGAWQAEKDLGSLYRVTKAIGAQDQGYLLSRPLPVAVFDEWLAEMEGSGLRARPARNVPTPAGALS